MFTFEDSNPPVIERAILWGDAAYKYPDKYMIVTNTYLEDAELYGDILAVLSPAEYIHLQKPKPMTPRYQVWEGIDLKAEGLGVVGFYM
ncbi:MAG: hypothetical protein FWF81_05790 [Defluviitaleaceae bacterium]|nr:hypothetical protein [Defluviitaleaceae bacterium]